MKVEKIDIRPVAMKTNTREFSSVVVWLYCRIVQEVLSIAALFSIYCTRMCEQKCIKGDNAFITMQLYYILFLVHCNCLVF